MSKNNETKTCRCLKAICGCVANTAERCTCGEICACKGACNCSGECACLVAR